MREFPIHIQKILNNFSQLPGVGPRSAFRMVSHLLRMSDESLKDFGNGISELKDKIQFCKHCFNISESDTCLICDNPLREKNKILIVEDVLDLVAFERVAEFKGRYHILGGVLSPLRGIGPNDIRLAELESRVTELSEEYAVELIIATNPNLEGEATAMYIKNLFAGNIKVNLSRIARGIPTGAEIDYADNSTLSQALLRRVDF